MGEHFKEANVFHHNNTIIQNMDDELKRKWCKLWQFVNNYRKFYEKVYNINTKYTWSMQNSTPWLDQWYSATEYPSLILHPHYNKQKNKTDKQTTKAMKDLSCSAVDKVIINA